MTTYIFNTKDIGQTFIDALQAATERGVDVRVIVDGVGELTSFQFPRASTLLKRAAVPVERFIPPSLIPPSISVNLRNHRKILLVDGELAFTGGMNISYKHLIEKIDNPDRVSDVHFRMTGPIVNQIQLAFMEDWGFVSGQHQEPPLTEIKPAGDAFCRAIIDGPNEYLDQLERVLVAVISSAEHRIAIMTPYFLPSRDLMAALRASALRGVDVAIILPGKIDHPIVQWATNNILHLFVQDGGQVYLQPAPFAHSKLLMVDNCYAMVGSANLDPRSLRLNFELVVEVCKKTFSTELYEHFYTIRQQSRLITLDELAQRSLPQRLRDALAWTCSPYL